MSISYVGGVTGGRAGATSTTTQSLSGTLTGGSNTSPSPGDLVVVWCSAGGDGTGAPTNQAISGNNNGAYTTEAFQSITTATYDSFSQFNYKIQGGTVDTSLTIPSSGNARNAQRWVVHVFRNVDATTSLDVTSVLASGTATGRPNPGAITPSTSGAWILAFYASAAATGTAYTAPTDFATDWLGGTTADTADCMQGGGYYTGWTSGAYDPAAITAGGTTNAADSWTAMTIALRPADVNAPTVVLNSPSDTATGISLTPTLNFTGTDAESKDVEYNVQVDTTNTFDSTIGSPTIIDSYSETNFGSNSTNHNGQSFTGNGGVLDSVKFYCANNLGATGNVYAKIYAHSGTFGTSSVPTGSALATSEAIDATTIGTSSSLKTFIFSGSNNIVLNDGTKYVVVFDTTGVTGILYVGLDNTSPSHAGNRCYYTTSWLADNTTDIIFYVYQRNLSPLLSKFSSLGDATFTSGHPFASGVAKDYTVQSADTLTGNTLYYWRVSAIDPTGSNTYGAWSSTRSFTTTTGSTTTTKTATGVSRIEKTATKTATGVSRVQKTTTQTSTGISKIVKTVQQTETGISRITATTQKTASGVSRITNTTTKTETGVSRIRITSTKTLTGISRITVATQKIATGISRIKVTTTKTQTGISAIKQTTLKTASGISRIQKSVSQTESGISRVQKTVNQTENGISRVTATTLKTLTGVSNIVIGTSTTTQTATGVSRIQKSVAQTETGISRVQKTVTQTESAVSRITVTTLKTASGVSRITKTAITTETGISRVQKSVLATETGVSRIQNSATQTESGISRLQKIVLRTETGISSIKQTTLRTETGTSRITNTTVKTESGISRVQVTSTKTATGVSRITVTGTSSQTLTGISRITRTSNATQTGISRIQKTSTATLSGVSRIIKQTQKTLTGISRITATTTKTEIGTSRIKVVVNRTETGISRITTTTTKALSGISRIVSGAVTTPLHNLSLKISKDLSTSLTPNGNMLEIEIVTTAPVSAPVNGKGVVFRVSAGVLTIYMWDGSNWIAK